MRNLIKILTAALLLLLVPGAPSATAAEDPPASAEQKLTFGIGPAARGLPRGQFVDGRPYFNFLVTPGTTIEERVAILNFAPEPLKLEVYATDALNGEDGAFGLLPGTETAKDAGRWLVLDTPSKRMVTVPAREGDTYGVAYLPVHLRVPNDASPGDHVGGIVASLKAESTNKQGAKITLDQRIAVRAYISVQGEKVPALEVKNLKAGYTASPNPFGSGTTTVTYDVRNTGNVRMNATQDLHLTSVFGASYDSKPADVVDLLPGNTIKFTQKVDGVWPLGPMTAEVTLHQKPVDPTIPEGERDVTAEVSFGSWNWLLMLVIGGILIVLALLFWWRRRRGRGKKQALAAPKVGTGGAHAADRTLTVRQVVTAALALGVAFVGVGAFDSADAADVPQWSATLDPESGDIDSPIAIVTSGGCPDGANRISARILGQGFPKEGKTVVGVTGAEVQSNRPILAPLSAPLRTFVADMESPQPFSGTYRLELKCRNTKTAEKSFGDYVVEVRFTDPQHWVTAKPVTKEEGPTSSVDEDGNAVEDPALTGDRAGAPTPGGSPGAGESPGVAPGPQAGVDDPNTATDESAVGTVGGPSLTAGSDTGVPPWVLLVAGFAVLLTTLYFLRPRRGGRLDVNPKEHQ